MKYSLVCRWLGPSMSELAGTWEAVGSGGDRQSGWAGLPLPRLAWERRDHVETVIGL